MKNIFLNEPGKRPAGYIKKKFKLDIIKQKKHNRAT
jgi:hypothetical protein